ncbi:hypothetical protein GCM10011413_00450 [Pedobacter psychrotolerans]|uniref:PepSY-associated transmembrane protein n=3 Tax=Pedobacter psychrotolerans TaxID=1843235 RepID=A0ABQ1SK77_9SPHI|nr:hypothetical protein GCM10011413_00450 [Pedobacter psychrotolerans]
MWTLPKQQENYLVPANIDRIVMKAKNHVIGFKPIAVNIPTVKGGEILVRGHMPSTTNLLLQGKASSIAFDAETGALKKQTIIDKQSMEERFEYMAYQLHAGYFGGDVLKWIYVFFGLSPAFLSITGSLLWMKRKYPQRRKG